MKIVITGGSGFIGVNLVELLLKNDCEIINYDIKKPPCSAQIRFWKNIDILNYNLFENQLINDQPDYIVHLAARTDLNEKKDIHKYDVNIKGVRNLMNISLKLNKIKRILVASSMLVCRIGYNFKSYDDYSPNTVYGESKVLTEKIVKEFNNNWVILRPTSIWGPWFSQPYLYFFQLVMRGLYFNVSERKSSTKTYGYVTNACIQIHNIMLSSDREVVHKSFYLGDEIPINITLWSNLIRKHVNKSKIIELPFFFLKLGSLIGDFFVNVLKISKFPLNSFRLKNMTTNNIINNIWQTNDLVNNKEDFIKLDEATERTISWINKFNKS